MARMNTVILTYRGRTVTAADLADIRALQAAQPEASHGHPAPYLATFVGPARFAGTGYRAANGRVLGLTSGLGQDAVSRQPNRSLKQVLGLPLHPDFRRRLGVVI